MRIYARKTGSTAWTEITGRTDIAVTEVRGLDYPPSEISADAAAGHDGAVFNSQRLTEREIVLTVWPDLADPQTARRALYALFPPKGAVDLRFADGLDVTVSGYVESIEADIFAQRQSMAVTILCTDPWLRGEAQTGTGTRGTITNPGTVASGVDITMTLASGTGQFTLRFGTSGDDDYYSVPIPASWNAGDVVHLCTVQGSKAFEVNGTSALDLLPSDWIWYRPKAGSTAYATTRMSSLSWSLVPRWGGF